MPDHTVRHTPHITDDLTPSFGENSWYLCRPLDECRSLLAEQASGYFAHAFKCKCGTQKILVSKSKQRTRYICKTCDNQQFLMETNDSNGYGILLAKVDVPIDYDMHDTHATATLSFLKPCGVNMAKDSMEFMPEVVYTLDISLQTGEYTPKFHYLLCDDVTLYAENELVIFVSDTYLKTQLKNYVTYCEDTVDSAAKKERLAFFLTHPHIYDAVQYRWFIPEDLHETMKTHNSVEETLAFLMGYRKERSVKRAFYERYVTQIKEGYFDTFSAYVICTAFEDPNLVCRLLKHTSLRLHSNDDQRTFFAYKKLFLESLAILQGYYPSSYIVTMLIESSYSHSNIWFLEDVMEMLYLQKRDDILENHFKKPKCNLMAIHDALVDSDMIRAKQMKHLKFNYDKVCEDASGLWKEEMHFILPLDAPALCSFATELNNCICSYADKVHKGSSIIYGIFIQDVLCYAIELDSTYNIVQASGQKNSDIPEKVLQNLHAWHKACFKNNKTKGA